MSFCEFGSEASRKDRPKKAKFSAYCFEIYMSHCDLFDVQSSYWRGVQTLSSLGTSIVSDLDVTQCVGNAPPTEVLNSCSFSEEEHTSLFVPIHETRADVEATHPAQDSPTFYHDTSGANTPNDAMEGLTFEAAGLIRPRHENIKQLSMAVTTGSRGLAYDLEKVTAKNIL